MCAVVVIDRLIAARYTMGLTIRTRRSLGTTFDLLKSIAATQM
jgi:hypothetical protein